MEISLSSFADCGLRPDSTQERILNLVAGERFERPNRGFRVLCLTTWLTGNIVTEGLEPSRYFYHKTLILARLPITPHDVYIFYRYGETRTPNPFQARTSQARMYTFHHIPLYRPGGTRTHTLAPQRLILSQLCLHSTTSRLQPYSDSNREPEIWSHVGYQLPHRAIYKKLRSLTFVGTLKFYLIQIKTI